MTQPLWSFGPASGEDIDAIFADVLSRGPTLDEKNNFRQWAAQASCRTENLVLFSRPWRPAWPILVFYSGCHTAPIVEYWRTRMDAPEVNIAVVFAGKVSQLDLTDFLEIPLLRALFEQAGYLVTQVSMRGSSFSDERVAELASAARVVRFYNPVVGCFWPVCWHFGTKPVTDLLRSGQTHEQIVQAFHRGTFNPQFEFRFEEFLGHIRSQEERGAMPFASFIQQNLRKTKLFFDHLHGTPGVYARLGADILTRMFGCRELSDEEVLGATYLDYLHWEVNALPETSYEWDYFKFEYPRAYEKDVAAFYAELIRTTV